MSGFACNRRQKLDEATVEHVAQAIFAEDGPHTHPWEMQHPYRIEEFRTMARAAIAAMGPAISPELIDKLSKLATYLTEQGEYEACDLIDTVVERLTPPPGAKP